MLATSSITIEDTPAILLAGVVHSGAYTGIGAAFDRLMTWAEPRGVLKPGARVVGVFYDNPRVVPAEKLRSRACIEVDASVRGDAASGVEVFTLAGGRCLTALLMGPYTGLPEAWARLMDVELPRRGVRVDPARDCYEVYLNMPGQVAPAELRTRLVVPVVG